MRPPDRLAYRQHENRGTGDLLNGRSSEATALRYVRRKPVPFPAEPLRWAVIELTRNRMAAADRRQGRRGLWLRSLDRLGLGFDS